MSSLNGAQTGNDKCENFKSGTTKLMDYIILVMEIGGGVMLRKTDFYILLVCGTISSCFYSRP